MSGKSTVNASSNKRHNVFPSKPVTSETREKASGPDTYEVHKYLVLVSVLGISNHTCFGKKKKKKWYLL